MNKMSHSFREEQRMRGTLKNDEYFAEKAESGSLPFEKTKKLVLLEKCNGRKMFFVMDGCF